MISMATKTFYFLLKIYIKLAAHGNAIMIDDHLHILKFNINYQQIKAI